MHDVVVVGGGPVGSRTACLLAQKGHRVLVLERKPGPGGKTSCTGIIGQECAGAFNVEDKVILRRVNSACIFSPSGNLLYVHREEPQACILDRVAFDIAMAERAQQAGAEYRFQSFVSGVQIGPGHINATVSRRGKESTLNAKAVVIAAGFAPGLLRRQGLGAFGDFTYGAQAEVETTTVDEVEVYFGDVAPDFFAWLVPSSPSRARAGLLCRRKPGEYLRKWLVQLESQGRISSADVKISYGAIPLKPPARTFGERLLVVGDAAGQVKPTSGGGIYYGLLCADIAVNVLHGALSDDDLSAGRLSRYEKAWCARLGKEMRNGYRARKLFERLRDKTVDRAFKIARSCGIEDAVASADGISFDWHSRTLKQVIKYRLLHGIGRR